MKNVIKITEAGQNIFGRDIMLTISFPDLGTKLYAEGSSILLKRINRKAAKYNLGASKYIGHSFAFRKAQRATKSPIKVANPWH